MNLNKCLSHPSLNWQCVCHILSCKRSFSIDSAVKSSLCWCAPSAPRSNRPNHNGGYRTSSVCTQSRCCVFPSTFVVVDHCAHDLALGCYNWAFYLWFLPGVIAPVISWSVFSAKKIPGELPYQLLATGLANFESQPFVRQLVMRRTTLNHSRHCARFIAVDGGELKEIATTLDQPCLVLAPFNGLSDS